MSKIEISQDRLLMMTQKKFLSFKEACLYLDVSKSFLYKLTSKNEIGFYKPKGKIYFSRDKLNEWMSQNLSESFKSREEEVLNYLKKEL